MKKILSLDLATECGWAFRSADGAIASGVTPFLGTLRPGDRWIRFSVWLDAWGDAKPDLLIYEAPFIHPKHRNGWGLAYGFTTLVQLFAAKNEIKLLSISPRELKKFATGSGGADKALMLRFARIELGYKGANDNECDALHLLHYAARTKRGKDEGNVSTSVA
jgi:hypothetical protein